MLRSRHFTLLIAITLSILFSSNYLKAQSCIDDDNIALSGTASASSTASGGVITAAIDDITAGNTGAGDIVFTSANETAPWWQVDFGSVQPIRNIIIWNRNNHVSRLNGAIVEILDASGNVLFTETIVTAIIVQSFELPYPYIQGQTVRIRHEGDNKILNLAEVQVFTQSPPTVKASAIAASCTDGIPNNDAFLQINEIVAGDKFGYSVGTTYTGPNYASANDALNASYPLILEDNLANPATPIDYVVRVYNGSDECYTDMPVTLEIQDCTISCNCEDYVYLNEIQGGGAVHKYMVAPDGSLTEVAGDKGIPWFSSVNEAPEDKMSSPHGLGTDLNGFLYIGETLGGDVRKLDCSGNIFPTSDFEIDFGGVNMQSIDNTLYVKGSINVTSFDLCTGTEIGYVVPPAVSNSWGMWIDVETETFYTTSTQNQTLVNELGVFQPTDADFMSNTVFPAVMTSDSNNPDPAIGTIGILPSGQVSGVVTDSDGFIYIVRKQTTTNSCARIYKYAPITYELVAKSVEDCAGDGAGFHEGQGIVYSENCNCLFLSTTSLVDDCIVQFSTDLSTWETAVPPVPGGGAKGISIMSECCPLPNRQTVDQVFCMEGANEKLFLNELFPCDGIICGGTWAPTSLATAGIYNECDQSISENIAPGCYSFTKVGSSGLCGAFELDFNLEMLETPEATVSADQTVCSGESVDLTVTTTATGFQWQMSTTSCTEGFTDIAGATSAMYMPTVTETTYYRVIVTEMAGCSDGSCAFESDCITVTVEDCAIYDVELTKSVDLSTASVGEDVVFTITVNNLEDAITGATVNDVLPSELTYNGVYTASTGTYNGANWTIGDMAVGATETIQITATVNAEGVINNMANVTINETEINEANNEDKACVSVPIQVCNNETIDVDLIAGAGLPMYQWYKDGVAIDGATSQTYNATEVGTYTYIADGAGPTGDCNGELCCPIVIEEISCCPPTQCLPVTVTKIE